MPIIDPAVAMRPYSDYSAYKTGVEQNVFLKLENGEIFNGRVWPGDAAFPDFFNDNTTKWWHNQLTEFHNRISFDGLWLDMNEAANFCNGACTPRQRQQRSELDYVTFLPTGRNIEQQSIAVDAVHYDGRTQLDAHSIYGAMQTKTTYDWFVNQNQKRPFIVERSSFAGMGKFGSKWLGDNSASFMDMQRSVTGTMMMNVFGIPFVGGDICGFGGPDTTPELCARWHQVGAFQPFSRNHRDCEGAPQEPYRFINETVGGVTVTDIMKDAILTKYSLQRYYYTQLFLLSKDAETVGSFYKPLFFEYPNDPKSYEADPTENVMLGSALKLSIKTQANTNWTEEWNTHYFPQGRWCDIMDPTKVCIDVNSTQGQMLPLPSNLSQYHLHLREGFIIPM